MRVLGDLRVVLLGLASATAVPGQVDVRVIIRNAVAADARKTVHYSGYSSFAAGARTVCPAEDRNALDARLNQSTKAIFP